MLPASPHAGVPGMSKTEEGLVHTEGSVVIAGLEERGWRQKRVEGGKYNKKYKKNKNEAHGNPT